MTPRPPRGSDGSYGPCGPAWTGRPGRPPHSRDAGRPPDSGMARRTGTGGVGSPRPFTSPPPAAHGSGSCAGILKDCNIPAVTMASGRRSGTGRPRRRTIRARSSRRRSPTSSATRSRRRPHGRTCSSSGGASWTIGKPALPASARGCRRPPGGSNEAPACGAWVSSTSHATTARGRPPRRWSAILGDGDRDALHRDRVVVPGAPARPLLTPCQVERLACTHSRPIRPRSG